MWPADLAAPHRPARLTPSGGRKAEELVTGYLQQQPGPDDLARRPESQMNLWVAVVGMAQFRQANNDPGRPDTSRPAHLDRYEDDGTKGIRSILASQRPA
jgi:hypothetical protein